MSSRGNGYSIDGGLSHLDVIRKLNKYKNSLRKDWNVVVSLPVFKKSQVARSSFKKSNIYNMLGCTHCASSIVHVCETICETVYKHKVDFFLCSFIGSTIVSNYTADLLPVWPLVNFFVKAKKLLKERKTRQNDVFYILWINSFSSQSRKLFWAEWDIKKEMLTQKSRVRAAHSSKTIRHSLLIK